MRTENGGGSGISPIIYGMAAGEFYCKNFICRQHWIDIYAVTTPNGEVFEVPRDMVLSDEVGLLRGGHELDEIEVLRE
jgi:hypothetical protein